MRALHVIPAVAPQYGGPSAAIAPMCAALMASGVETLILTTNAAGEGTLDVPIAVPTMWQGVPALFFNRDFSESFKYSSGLARWLRNHVSEFNIVHIHAVLSHASLAAASACRAHRIPYVLRPLGTLAPWSLAQKSVRKQVLLKLKASGLVRDATAVHCTSEQEHDEIVRAFPGARAVVIPLGIDPANLDTPVPSAERSREPYVLALARLHPKKNFESLIEAFARTPSQLRAPWRLVIAGSGDAAYESLLRQLARERDLTDRIRFTGWVEGESRRQLIRGASLFALPSLHENFGVSILEALAAGVPVIASRNVDLAHAVADAGAGWVVDSDVESVAAALSKALGDPNEREVRGRAARLLAERFTWPEIGRRLADLYGRTTSSGAPRRQRQFQWISSVSGESAQLHQLDDAMARYYGARETRLQYQAMVDSDDAVQPSTEQALRTAILARRPRSILEVGCGGGRLYRALRNDGYGGQYTGIEMSADVIARNRLDHPEATWFHESILSTDRLQNRFDVVFAYFVLEHIVYPARALEQMANRLRPGGAMILVFPDFVAMGRFASQSLGFVEGRAGELLRRGRPISALFNLYESRIRLPRALRQAAKRYGPFPINLAPRCLHTPEHVEPDVDAVYIASKEEVRAWAVAREMRVAFPAGIDGNFRDNVLIELATDAVPEIAVSMSA